MRSPTSASLKRFAGLFLVLTFVLATANSGFCQVDNNGPRRAESSNLQPKPTAAIYRSHNGLRSQETQQSPPVASQPNAGSWPHQVSPAFNNSTNDSAGTSDVRQATYVEPAGITPTNPATTSTSPNTSFESPRMQVEVIHNELALKPPSDANVKTSTRPRGWLGNLFSMVFSLLLVLGIFAILVWVVRKSGIQQSSSLPSPVLQVLGRSMLAPRQQLYVVRFGPKLLLVSHQLGQTQTLSEIDDPAEVERIAAACDSSSHGGVAKTFRQVFQEMAQKTSGVQRDSYLRVSKSSSSQGLATKG